MKKVDNPVCNPTKVETNNVNKTLRELNYIHTGDNEWRPAVLFSDETVVADWLGTPIAWTYKRDCYSDKDFETFEELVKFLTKLNEEKTT